MESTKTTKTLRLKKSTIKLVEEQALLENRNFSNMVETTLIRYFTKNSD